MPVTVLEFFLLGLVSFGAFFIGWYYKEYTWGIIGGFAIFLLGIYYLITPIDGVRDLINLTMASLFVGIGGYIFVYGSLEALEGAETK